VTKIDYPCVAKIEEEDLKLFKSYCAYHDLKIGEVLGDLLTKFVKRECLTQKEGK